MQYSEGRGIANMDTGNGQRTDLVAGVNYFGSGVEVVVNDSPITCGTCGEVYYVSELDIVDMHGNEECYSCERSAEPVQKTIEEKRQQAEDLLARARSTPQFR